MGFDVRENIETWQVQKTDGGKGGREFTLEETFQSFIWTPTLLERVACTGCLHSVRLHMGGIFIYTSAQLLSLLPVRYEGRSFAAEGNPVSPWITKLNGQNDTKAVRWNAGHPSGAHLMESGTLGHVEEGGGSNRKHL